MASIIVDPRPDAAGLALEYAALRDAGETLVLVWPHAAAAPGMTVAGDQRDFNSALEDGGLLCLPGMLPPWLAADDFQRILLLQSDPAGDAAWLSRLFAAGAEEVELLPPEAVQDLCQSWNSGRRTTGTFHRNPATHV